MTARGFKEVFNSIEEEYLDCEVLISNLPKNYKSNSRYFSTTSIEKFCGEKERFIFEKLMVIWFKEKDEFLTIEEVGDEILTCTILGTNEVKEINKWDNFEVVSGLFISSMEQYNNIKTYFNIY